MDVIFQNWFTQFLSIVGIIYIFGFAVWALNRVFYSMLGARAHGICVATGCVGTPIHELGHALFCIVFLHRITDISLFSPSAEDGVLGYVNHSYNKRNIYQQIGNFFIGVGPILFGSAVLFFLMYLLSPAMFNSVTNGIGSGGVLSVDAVLQAGKDMLSALFKESDFSSFKQWVFFILAVLITLHMSLSPADMKGSVVGTGYIAIFLLLANVVLSFFSIGGFSMLHLTAYCVDIGLTLAGFLFFAVIVAAIVAAIGVIVKVVLSILGR